MFVPSADSRYDNGADLLWQADRAMYRAKNERRPTAESNWLTDTAPTAEVPPMAESNRGRLGNVQADSRRRGQKDDAVHPKESRDAP